MQQSPSRGAASSAPTSIQVTKVPSSGTVSQREKGSVPLSLRLLPAYTAPNLSSPSNRQHDSDRKEMTTTLPSSDNQALQDAANKHLFVGMTNAAQLAEEGDR